MKIKNKHSTQDILTKKTMLNLDYHLSVTPIDLWNKRHR